MRIHTEQEEWLRSQLAVIAEPVRPQPDPYERLLRRHRASRVRRGAGAGAALMAAVAATVAATAVVIAPAGSGPTESTLVGRFRWIEELVESSPRGALAAEAPFRQELEERITQAVRSGEFREELVGVDGRLHPDQEVRLIFADDIDDRRIAVLALRLATPPDSPPYPAGPGRTHTLWLAGPLGASASSLASAVTSAPVAGVDSGSGNAEPFTIARVGEPSPSDFVDAPDQAALEEANAAITYIGLAPPGCSVLAAPATAPDAWVPEPTGSYIIRTPDSYRAEYWRVTCGGVVRQEGPVPAPTNGIPDDLMDPALADLTAPGPADKALQFGAQMATRSLADLRTFMTGSARVRYAGPAPGLTIGEDGEHLDTPRAVVVAAPRVNSTWFCVVAVSVGTSNSQEGTHATVVLDSDPLAPDATLAVSLVPRLAGPQVIALLPAAAATAQLVAANDTVLATSSIADTFAVLAVPGAYVVDQFRAPDGLRVVAYDAAGSVVATTPVLDLPSVVPVDLTGGDWD